MMEKEQALERLKYPIGKFRLPEQVNPESLEGFKSIITRFPILLQNQVDGIDPKHLLWKYRPDGWNIKQLVHHVADSHMNAMIRFKWALTEDGPTIKPYIEGKWAELMDSQDEDLRGSLAIIHGVHHRWNVLLSNMDEQAFNKTFFHPDSKIHFRLDQALAMYAWHASHHLAHVRQALEFRGKYN